MTYAGRSACLVGALMNIAMISYHTCPLAILGGKDTGGMNVYVRDLTRELGRIGVHVDVFTRSQDEHVPHVVHELGFGNRVVHVPAGPETPIAKQRLADFVPEFAEGVKKFAGGKGHPIRSCCTATTGSRDWPPNNSRTGGTERPSYKCSTLLGR